MTEYKPQPINDPEFHQALADQGYKVVDGVITAIQDPNKRIITYEIKKCPCCDSIIDEKIIKVIYNK